MKYKLIGIAAFLLAAVVVVQATLMEGSVDKTERVHQHLAAAEKKPCQADHSDGTLCTHLPLLCIETDGQTIPGVKINELDAFGESLYSTAEDGDSMIQVRMQVFDSPDSYNHPTDRPTLSTETRIRVRGHSSRDFEKAPYLLKLVTHEGEERDEALLGMSPHNEWALHGPYLDKSLLRNYLFYNLSGELMEYAPNCRFCELILNGDYRGVYLLTETITAGEGRLPINKKEKGSLLSGYLLRIDRPTVADLETLRDVDVLTERANIQRQDVEIRYPGKNRLTEEMKTGIERDFSAFEKALYSYDFDTGEYSYKQFIDVDNFVDYYIINAITSNVDAGRFSTYIYKSVDGLYRMCVWDFNNSCDNFKTAQVGSDFDSLRWAAYYDMLFRDRAFVKRVISRYHEQRKGLLSDAALDEYIDDTLAFLGDAVDRNSVRWADYIASDPLDDPEGTGRNPHSQAEAVAQLKDNLHRRLAWLDENIDYLLQFCAASANKAYSELPQ